jgi:hypothetical protein
VPLAIGPDGVLPESTFVGLFFGGTAFAVGHLAVTFLVALGSASRRCGS